MKLKPIGEQTIAITGATSGIGLVTARTAAEAGANVVLIARNQRALSELAGEINGKNGGRAIFVEADVADEAALHAAAHRARAEFGGFDTWVNNAAVSVFGRILEVPIEDMRRVVETNLWGVIYGSRVAAIHLKERTGKFGGAIINVGSELSDRAVPLQGIYTSTKHAVKAFTDALRIELEADKLPISVTLIKPGAIGTPYNQNARNYLPYEPKGPQPVFAPELVAEAILHCAEKPVRDMFVGESAKLHSIMGGIAPRLTDYQMERNIDKQQNSGRPKKANRPDGLYETNSKLQERDPKYKVIFEESPMQRAYRNPLVTATLLIGAGLGVAAYLNRKKIGGYVKSNRANGSAATITNGSAATITNGAATKTGDAPRMFPTRVGLIMEHAEVVSSDNQHVGKVDKVEGEHIKLTKNDRASGGAHHEIALDLVDAIENNQVRLNQTADQTRSRWQTA